MPKKEEVFSTYDPHTGEPAARFVALTTASLAAVCAAGKSAAAVWRKVSPEARARALSEAAAAMREQVGRLAALEARDTGKSLSQAAGEVLAAADLWDYAAGLARDNCSPGRSIRMAAGQALIVNEPMGLVGMIVPWNYPLITTSERLPFALAAGCCVILKPSELAAGALPALVGEILAAVFPADVVQIVYGAGDTVAQALCSAPEVEMISFVGSTRVGRLVETAAVKHGKRVSSELGGNNFMLVHEDADLIAAAQAAIRGGMRNAGQACIAGSHVLVSSRVAEKFGEHLEAALKAFFPAHGKQCPTIQPMITRQARSRIAGLIEQGIAEGLPMLPGSCPEGEGNRVGPVVFVDVPLSSVLLKDELFGPLMTVSTVDDADFFDIVNASGYGLAAYVWTGSSERASHAMTELRIGRIWINADPEFWLPELPVGGFGLSGTGREMGPSGLDTYSLPKSVLVS